MPVAFKNMHSPGLVECLAAHLARQFSASQTIGAAVKPELGTLELTAHLQLIADDTFGVLPSHVSQ